MTSSASWGGGPILAGIGLVVSLVWFRRQGRKAERFPKAVKLWLAVLTVWLAVVFLIALLALRDPQGFLAMWGEVPLTYFSMGQLHQILFQHRDAPAPT